jgi:hypothetical protein
MSSLITLKNFHGHGKKVKNDVSQVIFIISPLDRMNKLTEDEKQLLARHERAKEKARERQKRYMDKMKDDPDWKTERAAYMREYNAKTRVRLQRIQDEVGYVPKVAEIPSIEPLQVDKRTKKGKQALRSFEIKPSFQNRKFSLQPDTVKDYVDIIVRMHGLFTGKKLNPAIKQKISTIIGGDTMYALSDEIEAEMPYLVDADRFIEWLRKKYQNDNTYKKYMTPFTVLTSHLVNLQDSYQKFTRTAIKTNQSVEETRKQNIIKEGDEDKVIDLDKETVLKNIDKLDKLQDKLIYGFYTLMPARRVEDVSVLILTYETNTKKLQENNYIIAKKPMRVVYNDYKTDKAYGQQVFDIPLELEKLLDAYIKDNSLIDGQYLFWNRNDNVKKNSPVASSNFGTRITNITKKVHGVDGIGVTKIRQSHATALTETGASYAEREKVANMMAHSLDQNLKYAKIRTKKVKKEE